MFCPKCGTYNQDENSFCFNCKYSFEQVPTEIRNFKTDVGNERIAESVRQLREKPKKKVKDYFVYSILTALLCSVVFGTAALVFSGLTKAEQDNNSEKAESYSKKAKMFCNIALAVGIAKYLFVLILILILLATIGNYMLIWY